MDLKNISIRHNAVKRFFDIFFSVFALIISTPLMILIALIIRATSQGNVVYSQERVGRGGKSFKCYKFRTMYKDADEKLHEILNSCPHKKQEWEENRKLKKDPRVTPIGNFLRKTSLDEFPQFWNVLKGDLSVVGPRAVVQQEILKHYKDKAFHVLSVRPGLTGLWQVSGRSDVSYEKRVEMDIEYVGKQSLFLDIKIISQTIPKMLSSKGAY